MDLVRSWAVGIGVWLVGSIIAVALFIGTGSFAQIQSFGGRVVAFYLPELIVAVLTAGAAALVHPAPARERGARHAAAVFAVPAVVLLGSLVNSAIQGVGFEVYLAALVTVPVGSVIGWRIADAVRPVRQRRTTTYGYPY